MYFHRSMISINLCIGRSSPEAVSVVPPHQAYKNTTHIINMLGYINFNLVQLVKMSCFFFNFNLNSFLALLVFYIFFSLQIFFLYVLLIIELSLVVCEFSSLIFRGSMSISTLLLFSNKLYLQLFIWHFIYFFYEWKNITMTDLYNNPFPTMSTLV